MGMEPSFLTSLLYTLKQVHTEADLERFQAHQRRSRRFLAILAVGVFLAFMLNILTHTSDHLQNHDWLGLTLDTLSAISLLLILFALPFASKSLKEYRLRTSSLPRKMLELREQLHNEGQIPAVAEQPLPLATEELPLAPKRIGPVRRVEAILFLLVVVIILLVLFDIFLGAVIVTLPWSTKGQGSATLNFWVVVAIGVVLLVSILGTVILLVLAGVLMRGSTVVVDGWGLRWSWLNVSTALGWPEITGFYVITNQGSKDTTAKTYLLDSPSSTFFWPLWKDSSQEELQASTYLTRLIVTHTCLPLRDLTSAVELLLNPPPETKEAGK